MNRVLKYAWYQLIVTIAATLFATVVLLIAAKYWRGKEFSAVIPFCLFVFVHLYRVIFPLKPGEIAFDERDVNIKNRATRISFTIFWYVFALSCLIPILVIGNGSIHVMYLGGVLLGAAILIRITWTIAVIVQYGRGGKGDNS
jgi:uncharacterized membrane protein